MGGATRGPIWWHTLLLSVTASAVLLASAAGAAPTARLRVSALQPLRSAAALTAYTQDPCAPVYAQPSASSLLLTQLPGGADVTAAGELSSGGVSWTKVGIWSGVEGYMLSTALGSRPPASAGLAPCDYPGLPPADGVSLPTTRGPWPLQATATIAAPTTLYFRADDTSLPLQGLGPGTVVTITAWASDDAGRPWYQVMTAQGGSGWLWAAAARIDAPNPATQQVQGKPIWARVAGKGMWFTNYLPHHADMGALMRAAKLAGITHVYAEVAISTYGFYGQNSLDRLLPAAHAAGISVIAWVYPYLRDVSADVRLTTWVASYRTPSGDRPDGIATDVEETMDSGSVYAYGQLLRALLGPDELLVDAAYHPFARAGYPYSSIAASWNVLAPMDYWHSRQGRTYGDNEVTRFVTTSIQTVRAAMGAAGATMPLPIEELGQTYDMYSNDGTGAYDAPTGAEITADMRAARDSGAIGVSWFEWQTATRAEWDAITAFTW
ncbi:MAG: hypothetical protein IVW57_01585 [Ktedonobacterales bacterium]|nr:hypothetical protein [Ktedonobacterales bacterium]